jgi:hypothetical protein
LRAIAQALRAPEVMTFVIHFDLICHRISFCITRLCEQSSVILRLVKYTNGRAGRKGNDMNTKLLKSMVGILVMGIAANAHATNYTLTLNDSTPPTMPTLSPGDTANFSNSVSPGATFTDNWFFGLGGTGAGGSATNIAVSVGPTYLLNISPFTVSLYSQSGGVIIPPAIVTGTSFNLPSLPSGLYDLVITGTATGTAGGQYAGAVAASAVPLPAAAWLLLSGIAGVGAMARRRKIEAIDA